MKPHNLAFALLLAAVLWVVIGVALTGCSTPKWVAKAQNGRGITPAEAAGCTNTDLGVWEETPTLDEVC